MWSVFQASQRLPYIYCWPYVLTLCAGILCFVGSWLSWEGGKAYWKCFHASFHLIMNVSNVTLYRGVNLDVPLAFRWWMLPPLLPTVVLAIQFSGMALQHM